MCPGEMELFDCSLKGVGVTNCFLGSPVREGGEFVGGSSSCPSGSVLLCNSISMLIGVIFPGISFLIKVLDLGVVIFVCGGGVDQSNCRVLVL